jgi:hypothetical protein
MATLRSLSRVLLAAAVLALPACDATGPKTGPAAQVVIVSGNAQTGPALAELPQPLVVKVTDAQGRPVKGQAVSFVVTAGGGQVFAGTATTNDDGIAQERWTLGGVAGAPQTLEARAVNANTGQVLAFTTFTATATPGAPAQAAPFGPSIFSGDTIVAGVVGSVVADSFAVIVRDAAGNPVPGAQVTWTVTSGGGSITSPTTTDAAGVARTQWVLGTGTAPTQTAQATVGGATVRFTAYPATALNKTSGDGVTAGTGSTVTVTLTATGPSGTIGGLPIHWTVGSGGGSVTPAVGETSRHNFNQGTASAAWTLGPSAGTQTLTASAGGLSVTFTASATLAATRTLLATVPGRVLDATSDRVLWLESGTGVVKLRTLATGADAGLMATSGTTTVVGYLFTGGALVYSGAGLFEFRGGTTTNLGSVFGLFSAEGEWAAWSVTQGNGGQVIRRNLATGTNLVIANFLGFSVDVGANGDVVFSGRRYRDGTITEISTEASATAFRTDGVNVVYSGSNQFGAYAYLDLGDDDLLLFQQNTGFAGLRLNAGWVAWSTLASPAQRRTPAGVVQQVSPEDSGTRVDGLGPDGTVVYRYPLNGGRYYLVTPAGTRYDLGPAGDNDVVVEHGGSLFLLSGGSAYRVAP